MTTDIDFENAELIRSGISVSEARQMEVSEITYWQRLYDRYCDFPKIDNVYFVHLDGVGIFLMPDQDILAFNRVLGLGLFKNPTAEYIENIADLYRTAGIKRFFVQLCPFAHEDTAELLRNSGFQHYSDWVKLFRPLNQNIPSTETELKIVEIGERHRKIFAEVMAKSFDFPAIIGHRFSKTIGTTGYRNFMAFYGKKPVAAASLYIHGNIASMAGAGTLPEFRGMGAQTALLSARMHLARKLGCKYAIVETARETVEKKVSSFRNMIKAGFKIAYIRPNFIKYLE